MYYISILYIFIIYVLLSIYDNIYYININQIYKYIYIFTTSGVTFDHAPAQPSRAWPG